MTKYGLTEQDCDLIALNYAWVKNEYAYGRCYAAEYKALLNCRTTIQALQRRQKFGDNVFQQLKDVHNLAAQLTTSLNALIADMQADVRYLSNSIQELED